jgi:hypothetical protein
MSETEQRTVADIAAMFATEDPAFNYFHAELFSCIPPEPRKFLNLFPHYASREQLSQTRTLRRLFWGIWLVAFPFNRSK